MINTQNITFGFWLRRRRGGGLYWSQYNYRCSSWCSWRCSSLCFSLPNT